MVGETPIPPLAKVQDVITTFRPTRLFKAPPNASYTSIDFDDSGEFLLLARTDDTIQLFNTKAGAHAKELKSQKYGNALARFTHHSTSILYASTKSNNDIRYLSMHDNNYIRYFKGHTDRVTSLNLSPSNDQFMSAGLDDTVRLWDCRSPNVQGLLNFNAPWLTAYDPSGSVIAIASPPAQALALYDLRHYDKPPFATFDYLETESRFASHGQNPGAGWTGIEFSNNGKYILISTNGPGHYLVDAFTGDLVHYLQRPAEADPSHFAPGDELPGPSSSNSNGEGGARTPSYYQASASFSPDGRYVVGGNASQTGLLVWDAQEAERNGGGGGGGKPLEPASELPSQRPARVVMYNPRHNLLASADKEVMLWLPDPDLA